MAKIGLRGTIEAKIVMELSEAEAGALDALVGYGFEPFKKVFYEKLGSAYMEPYEAGLKSLFQSIRSGEGNVSTFLERSRQARSVFNGTHDAVIKTKPGKESHE